MKERNEPANPREATTEASDALSVLEADQVVSVKQHTRFGRRRLSLAMRVMLWALRVYVVLMMVIVAVSVYRAAHGS